MTNQGTSPTEPSKTYIRLLGRGGVGNIQEAKKWDQLAANETPALVTHLDHGNQVRFIGRGGTGNVHAFSDEATTESQYRLSTTAKERDFVAFGRGGAGNIEAGKAMKKKQEEDEIAKRDAIVTENAKAEARAAVEKLQVPKPARAAMY